MFGYIKPFKPYMRVFEYDIYKSVYCGLCKDMSRRQGFVTRFTLSYDFAFLAIMDLALRQKKINAKKQRCIAHPLKKSLCLCGKNSCRYSSDTAVILTYHKLKDDLADKGIKGKAAAAVLLPFFKEPYKKARKKNLTLAKTTERLMELQRKTEREKNASIDLACEPTAQMMSAAFGGLSGDKQTKAKLKRFGYLLGRFVYLCDALDDLEEDIRKGNYNPLKEISGDKKLNGEMLKKVYAFTDMTVNLTLGAMAEVYISLDIKMYREILDNVVYLGLKNVYNNIKEKKEKGEYKYE